MNHLSYLVAQLHGFMMIGAVLFVVGVFVTVSGQGTARFRRLVHNAEDPTRFWWDAAIFYLGGLLLLGMCLYQIAR